VFKLTPDSGGTWDENILYTFTGGNDGKNANAGLFADASGALYGTTIYGGTGSNGTVFKLTPPTTTGGAWTETVLHSFMPAGSEGGLPETGALIADASGALYGTTLSGGNGGTVFKLTPPTTMNGEWTETVLISGLARPYAGLIADASGALYGTAYFGGTSGFGSIFKLTPPTTTGGTWTETVLYSFTGGVDGAYPQAGLIADASGTLYGTTAAGGSGNPGYGTVFKLTFPTVFVGLPGQANCVGQSISVLAKKYGGISAAPKALGYASVADLQNAVKGYCAS
jgi:uncharacterized repeat protein (TIGR03803 family)